MTPEVRRTSWGEVQIWGLSDTSAQLLAQLVRSSITADDDDGPYLSLGQTLMFERLADELDQGYLTARSAIFRGEADHYLGERTVGRDYPGLNEPRQEAS